MYIMTQISQHIIVNGITGSISFNSGDIGMTLNKSGVGIYTLNFLMVETPNVNITIQNANPLSCCITHCSSTVCTIQTFNTQTVINADCEFLNIIFGDLASTINSSGTLINIPQDFIAIGSSSGGLDYSNIKIAPVGATGGNVTLQHNANGMDYNQILQNKNGTISLTNDINVPLNYIAMGGSTGGTLTSSNFKLNSSIVAGSMSFNHVGNGLDYTQTFAHQNGTILSTIYDFYPTGSLISSDYVNGNSSVRPNLAFVIDANILNFDNAQIKANTGSSFTLNNGGIIKNSAENQSIDMTSTAYIKTNSPSGINVNVNSSQGVIIDTNILFPGLNQTNLNKYNSMIAGVGITLDTGNGILANGIGRATRIGNMVCLSISPISGTPNTATTFWSGILPGVFLDFLPTFSTNEIFVSTQANGFNYLLGRMTLNSSGNLLLYRDAFGTGLFTAQPGNGTFNTVVFSYLV